MKKIQKFVCLLLSLMMVLTPVVYAEDLNDSSLNKEIKISKEVYNKYLEERYDDIRSEGGIVSEINSLLDSSERQISVTVPEETTYVLGVVYKSAEHKKPKIVLSVKINSASFEEDIKLDKIYQDVGGIRTDSYGNEFSAAQGDFEKSALIYPINSSSENYNIKLTKGDHIISLTSLNDSLYVSSIILKPFSQLKNYTAPSDKGLYYSGEPIICEGENSLWKNSNWLISQADNGSWNVAPENPVLTKVNYIGGSNWKKNGETITWSIKVNKDGYYKLGFSYRQSLVVNYSSYRTLLIDGVCPFAEVEDISFPYGHTWDRMTLSDKEGTPYLFYLDEGIHTISLRVSLGEYKDICERLEKVVGDLGNLYLKITMITGETVDISRDYDIFKNIPDLEERLTSDLEELNALEKEIIALSDGESSSYSLVLRNMAYSINQMLNNKYSATRYTSDFYTNYSSLSVCLSDMQEMPLDIDQIILGAPDEDTAFVSEGGIKGFFKMLWFSTRRFLNSFTDEYDDGSRNKDNSKNLTIWVNWGQDQARVLNSMIQSDFSTKYDIDVEVQVVNATVIQAILSGNGPDVMLQQARTEPVNLAMRGALYDLKNFSDYKDVLGRFTEGAENPYYYKDGLYALPDTQTFSVLFYRKDILDELKIKVPTTWEEFISAAEVLLHNNLSACLSSTSSVVATTGISTGLYPTLLLQNNVELYSKDRKSTNLTSAEALNVFKDWTDFYTELKLPAEMNFYNRFRAGTTPLGIDAYSTAVTITAEAPELEGLWGMTSVPATVMEDGTLNSKIAGGGTACSILNISKNKKGAWKFLKWWTSAETQVAYSTNLESILGPLGRVMVSNTEALKNLSWTDEEISAILKARENIEELPEVPGGYQVTRSIDMAFYNVINNHVNPKDIMTEWGKNADKEIQRKWEQYDTNKKK